ncbi:MAG: hypothetical protein H6721_33040 [Sandaracinus sp.]|nr:hypothetical protein [Sandaracinus sp.]MCB9624304.1 hypothetical protein [Sandaracinus sp.]MCB9631293.1 hypothetical protein [Sandaracinus sp.]MCB9636959.1 hypothetical protein [Sandaracinus sp.]
MLGENDTPVSQYTVQSDPQTMPVDVGQALACEATGTRMERQSSTK